MSDKNKLLEHTNVLKNQILELSKGLENISGSEEDHKKLEGEIEILIAEMEKCIKKFPHNLKRTQYLKEFTRLKNISKILFHILRLCDFLIELKSKRTERKIGNLFGLNSKKIEMEENDRFGNIKNLIQEINSTITIIKDEKFNVPSLPMNATSLDVLVYKEKIEEMLQGIEKKQSEINKDSALVEERNEVNENGELIRPIHGR